MIKVYINNEEVLCDKNIVIKKEMLNTSSTILNNVYPKSWETTHDYTTNYYYPLDYSNCKITDIRETPAEEGQTIEGTNFNINVDLSKEYSFDSFKGNTTQNGTPTPDAPIPINVVSGDNTIDICGKNLLGIEFTNSYSGRGFIFEDSIMTYYGNGNLLYTSDKYNINIQSGNNVTMSLEYDSGTLNSGLIIFRIDFYDSNDTLITHLSTGDVGTNAYKTKIIKTGTLNQNVSYIKVYVQSYQTNLTGDLKFKCQLELNNQATTYIPYVSQIYPINLGDKELCKIGDYQDRIYKDSGKWYLEKKIGKVVLDGSEEWKTDNIYNNINQYSMQEPGVYQNYDNVIRILSNHFKGYQYSSSWKIDNSITISGSTSASRIRVMTSLYTTVGDFKTWLSTHNTTCYYVLATPTTTEITDTELISQLESIELIEGTNNISSNGNLPIIMNLHYNYVTHRIDTTLLFSGIVKNTGNISLNPREPHYTSIEVLGYETFLSEGETLDFVIYEKTIEEAIDLVINTISDYGIIKGNINIKNPNDIIGAYSTKDKTAYDVFNYIADITQSRWTTRIIDENTIAIDFYDPDLMTNGTDLDFTQEFFANNNIIDMQYNYGTRDYRNKQVMNSSAVYSNIETNETIIADGYQTQFNTTDKIGEITRMKLNGSEVIVKTKNEYELGYTCDFYYTPGNNYFESVDLVSTGAVLVIDYYAIIQGREILLNNTEINRVSSMTGRKGVISRYEDRNDATTTTELSQIGQSYLRYKGSPEIILTIESLNDIWNIGEKVEFNNAPLNELATEYMVKKKTIHYIPTVDNIFYEFELTSNFNSENAINYFDNQRSKNKGNIGQGETISRNIDISNTANVIFYDVDIQEVSVDGDNILNSTLNSPLVQ